MRVLSALQRARSAGRARRDRIGPRAQRDFDRVGDSKGARRRDHRAGNYAHPRGVREESEARAGGNQAAQNGPGAAGLHPNRGASVTAMAESIKAGTAAGARLTRWPGLIEHYRRFLPVTDKTPVVTLNEGNTPLIESPDLADRVGRNIKVYLKFEGANPTGSFKDRGMTVAMSKALGEGVRAVICASTGNTSASAAAYAGRAGLQAYVLIPKGAVSLGKLSQSLIHGAKVIEIVGNFDICLTVVRDL